MREELGTFKNGKYIVYISDEIIWLPSLKDNILNPEYKKVEGHLFSGDRIGNLEILKSYLEQGPFLLLFLNNDKDDDSKSEMSELDSKNLIGCLNIRWTEEPYGKVLDLFLLSVQSGHQKEGLGRCVGFFC
jgi:hypothetical protein